MRAVGGATGALDLGEAMQRVVLEALVELVQAVVAAAEVSRGVVAVELLLDQLGGAGRARIGGIERERFAALEAVRAEKEKTRGEG